MALVNNLFPVALAFLFAPLLSGVIKRAKAFLQGRSGPSVLQVYRDIAKLFSREAVISEHASPVSAYAPWLIMAAVGAAVCYVPLYTGAPLGRSGDVFIVIYLLAMMRVCTTLLGLDGATNFGGMGAGRELHIGALVEPVFMVGLLAIALPAGTTGLSGMMLYLQANGLASLTLGHLLALAALSVVLVAETGRIPVDNPDTHLELTMVHEGMVLDISGWQLALITWAHSVKQLLLCSLIANLALPWHPFWLGILPAASVGHVGVWLAGVVFYCLKVLVVGLILAATETANAKMRYFKLQYLLGVALFLGVVGAVINL